MKAIILGLGSSIKDYKGNGDVLFGVNDIWRFHPVHHLFVQNFRNQFTAERLSWIDIAEPLHLYSSLDSKAHNGWNTHPCYKKIELLSPQGAVNFNSPKTSWSLFTPFSCMDMAVKLGATSMEIYGVDLVGHPVLGEEKRLNKCIKHIRGFLNKCPIPVKWAESSPLAALI